MINLSNIIILCASYRAGQKRVLDKKLINAMKGKYFVNIARGELLDENHLISKISASYFKGIALDVIQGENSEKNNLKKLISLSEKNNLILTPHIAGVTVESFKKTELFIVKKLAKNLTISK